MDRGKTIAWRRDPEDRQLIDAAAPALQAGSLEAFDRRPNGRCSHSNSTGNLTDRYATNELQPKNFAHLAHDCSLCWHPVSPLEQPKERDLSRPAEAPATPGEIIPEWWATSSRNGGRRHPGIVGGLLPESGILPGGPAGRACEDALFFLGFCLIAVGAEKYKQRWPRRPYGRNSPDELHHPMTLGAGWAPEAHADNLVLGVAIAIPGIYGGQVPKNSFARCPNALSPLLQRAGH
jgi:hypothetical protein